MPNAVMNRAKEKMDNAIGAFTRELATIRAGRANASLLDRISIDYYGAPTPLNQMAGISVPEAAGSLTLSPPAMLRKTSLALRRNPCTLATSLIVIRR